MQWPAEDKYESYEQEERFLFDRSTVEAAEAEAEYRRLPLGGGKGYAAPDVGDTGSPGTTTYPCPPWVIFKRGVLMFREDTPGFE